MKKLRIFAVSASLLLVTVGVFAGKSKYFTSYILQAYSPTTGYVAISNTWTGTLPASLSLTGTNAITLNAGGGSYTLYVSVNGTEDVCYPGTF